MKSLNSNSTHNINIGFLKAFGISCVVLGHMNTPLTPLIFSFHMPLFFFIAGLTLHTKHGFNHYLQKSIASLLAPYIIFGLLGITVELIKCQLLDRSTPLVSEHLFGLLIWMDISHLKHYGFVLWFLPALFTGRLLVFSYLKYVNRPWLGFLLFLFISFGATQTTALPFVLDKAALATSFIYFGWLYQRYGSRIHPSASLLALSLLIVLPIPTINMAMTTAMPFHNALLYSLSIIGILIMLSNYGSTKWIQTIGQGSLFILIFHPYLNNLSYLLVQSKFQGSWIIQVVLTFALVAMALAIKNKCQQRLNINTV